MPLCYRHFPPCIQRGRPKKAVADAEEADSELQTGDLGKDRWEPLMTTNDISKHFSELMIMIGGEVEGRYRHSIFLNNILRGRPKKRADSDTEEDEPSEEARKSLLFRNL